MFVYMAFKEIFKRGKPKFLNLNYHYTTKAFIVHLHIFHELKKGKTVSLHLPLQKDTGM